MKRLSWATVALGAALALGGVNTAKADYAWDFTGSGGLGGSLGTLAITENAADTQIVYKVTLAQGAIWTSGLTTFFADVTGTITNVALSGTNGGHWSLPPAGKNPPLPAAQ